MVVSIVGVKKVSTTTTKLDMALLEGKTRRVCGLCWVTSGMTAR
jgi:hypothetical protein